MGEFIDFLYANIKLGPKKGDEHRVYTIPAYRGPEYTTGCYSFTPEELENINRTGCLFISTLGGWPPMKVDAGIPVHRPTNLIFFGDLMPKICHLLQYLDLNLVLLEVPDDETGFIWRDIPKGGHDSDGRELDVYDMEYRVKSWEGTAMVESGIQGGKYLFGAKLEILGRLADLPKLQPLKMIYPSLKDSHLILMEKEVPPPPPILDMQGDRLN